MPLTPEDVVNKRFQPTKFREGYDQDEVDDFLDEVVVELRRLTQENGELTTRLATAESAAAGHVPSTTEDAAGVRQDAGTDADPIADATVVDAVVVDALMVDAAVVDATIVDAVVVDAADEDLADPATSESSAPQAAGVSSAGGAGDTAAGSSGGLLRLARRLHDEHVREGVERRDALIADGDAVRAQVIADGESEREQVLLDAEAARAAVLADAQSERERVVADGRLEADRVLADLGERQRELTAALETERGDLEEQVEALQEFEREYRDRLRGYIEGQLRELDATVGDTTDIDDIALADRSTTDGGATDDGAPASSAAAR